MIQQAVAIGPVVGKEIAGGSRRLNHKGLG